MWENYHTDIPYSNFKPVLPQKPKENRFLNLYNVYQARSQGRAVGRSPPTFCPRTGRKCPFQNARLTLGP